MVTAASTTLLVLSLYLIHPQPGRCVDPIALYSKDKDDVKIPCGDVVDHDPCRSTTWLYARQHSSEAIELVTHGSLTTEGSSRADRLGLESDCSLKITQVTSRDVGEYTCQQFSPVNEQKQGEDAMYYLSILAVTTSTAEADLKVNSTVTFYCSLATYDCSHSGLRWVGYSPDRHQIQPVSSCNISLVVKLTREDHNWRLGCVVGDGCGGGRRQEGGECKASVDYTIRLPGQEASFVVGVLGAVAGLMSVAACACLLLLWRRKSKQNSEDVKSHNGDTEAMHEKANLRNTSERKSQQYQDDQVLTYVEIDTSAHRSRQKPTAREVTEYATIKTTS